MTGEFRDVERILEETHADRVPLAPWVPLLGVDDETQNDALAELVSNRVAVLGATRPTIPMACAGRCRAAWPVSR